MHVCITKEKEEAISLCLPHKNFCKKPWWLNWLILEIFTLQIKTHALCKKSSQYIENSITFYILNIGLVRKTLSINLWLNPHMRAAKGGAAEREAQHVSIILIFYKLG